MQKKKKINNKAGRGADAQAPFCSIAHSLSCTAQPGAVLAHPLLGVLHKRLKSSRYRQDTPNPHFFFPPQDRPCVSWPDSRSARHCVRQPGECQPPGSAGGQVCVHLSATRAANTP